MARFILKIDIDDSAEDMQDALLDELFNIIRTDVLSAFESVCETCDQVH